MHLKVLFIENQYSGNQSDLTCSSLFRLLALSINCWRSCRLSFSSNSRPDIRSRFSCSNVINWVACLSSSSRHFFSATSRFLTFCPPCSASLCNTSSSWLRPGTKHILVPVILYVYIRYISTLTGVLIIDSHEL